MEKNFEMIELSLDDLASVSGCGDAADAGTADGGTPAPKEATVECRGGPGGGYEVTRTNTDAGTIKVTVQCHK